MAQQEEPIIVGTGSEFQIQWTKQGLVPSPDASGVQIVAPCEGVSKINLMNTDVPVSIQPGRPMILEITFGLGQGPEQEPDRVFQVKGEPDKITFRMADGSAAFATDNRQLFQWTANGCKTTRKDSHGNPKNGIVRSVTLRDASGDQTAHLPHFPPGNLRITVTALVAAAAAA